MQFTVDRIKNTCIVRCETWITFHKTFLFAIQRKQLKKLKENERKLLRELENQCYFCFAVCRFFLFVINGYLSRSACTKMTEETVNSSLYVESTNYFFLLCKASLSIFHMYIYISNWSQLHFCSNRVFKACIQTNTKRRFQLDQLWETVGIILFSFRQFSSIWVSNKQTDKQYRQCRYDNSASTIMKQWINNIYNFDAKPNRFFAPSSPYHLVNCV